MSEQPDNPTARRRALRYVIPGVVLCALLAVGAWWLAGRRVWTDDRTIHVRAADAEVREVLWTRPQPPGEVFNSADEEYEPSVSPDGSELYFVRGKAGRNAEIFVSRRERGRWLEPVPVEGVNSPADDLGPRLMPDGRFLLFYSDRPGGQGGYDIWAAPRGDDGAFGEPFNLGPTVNTEFNEYSPAPTPDGRRLYFATNRKAADAEQKQAWRATIRQSANGDYDLFVAVLESDAPVGATLVSPSPIAASQPSTAPASPDGTIEPRATQVSPLRFLPASEVPGVNTPFHEGASCVSTAGDFLYFASNRPGGVGKFDLYRCRLRDDGTLSPPENLGRGVNTPDNETDPQLAVGGFHLLFSSDRAGEAARGGYDLLASESREVYVLRQPRPTPHLGWSWWVLLGGLLLLLPLLSYLRGWNDHRLNLIQKCMLVSLLLHVLFTIALSLVFVSKQIVEYVRTGDGGGMEGAVAVVPGGGGGGGGADIGAEIRRQVSDTPVDLPEPTGFSRQAPVTADELGITPDQLAVNVPSASRAPADQMTVAVRAVPRDVVPPSAERVTVAPPAQVMPPAAPDLNFDATARVSQVAPEMRAASEAPPALRASPSPAPAAAPQPFALGVQASGAPAGGAVEAPPHLVWPNLLSVETPGGLRPGGGASGAGVGADAIASGTGPSVQGPSIASEKIAAAAPEGSGGVGDGPGGTASAPLERQGTAGAGTSTGRPASVQTDIPSAVAGSGVPGGNGSRASGSAALTAPAPGPRIDSLTTTGSAAPSPTASVDPLPAGPPALAGAGSDAKPGSPAGIQAPSPSIPSVEEPTTPGRAAYAGAPGGGAGMGSAPATVSIAPGPVGAGAAGGTGPAGALVGPRAVEVIGGRPGPATDPSAIADSVASPSLQGIGPATSPVARMAPAAGAGSPIAADDAQPAGLRLGQAGGAGADNPDIPSSLVASSSAPAARRPAAGAGGPGLGGLHAMSGRVRGGDVVAVPLNLEVAIAGPPIGAPEGLSQRSVAARKPLLEKMGGTKQSEDAVDRALAYLARQQEPEGRWTYVLPGRKPRRGRSPHDMALTGLATLCFLASDHTPDKPGPYREVVGAGINYLVENQDDDGDLRGPMAGGGADAGNMYDQGIATLALAEAGLMTGERRVIDAALKGARYIVKAQNRETGGWRYLPGEAGDTSIFGWQVMALHSAEQLGFEVPQATRDAALRYVRRASTGRQRTLGSYMPGNGPSTAMTAELLFARILLGDALTPDGGREACAFLSRNPPSEDDADFYGVYYASLSLLQLQNDAWKQWNERTRDTLVRMQKKNGDDAGCWDGNITWSDRGGRVFSTALGCLTLQVYYRYLPLDPNRTTTRPATPDVGYLPR